MCGVVHSTEMTARPLPRVEITSVRRSANSSQTSNPNQIGFCIAATAKRHNKVTRGGRREGDKWIRSKYPIHFGGTEGRFLNFNNLSLRPKLSEKETGRSVHFRLATQLSSLPLPPSLPLSLSLSLSLSPFLFEENVAMKIHCIREIWTVSFGVSLTVSAAAPLKRNLNS